MKKAIFSPIAQSQMKLLNETKTKKYSENKSTIFVVQNKKKMWSRMRVVAVILYWWFTFVWRMCCTPYLPKIFSFQQEILPDHYNCDDDAGNWGTCCEYLCNITNSLFVINNQNKIINGKKAVQNEHKNKIRSH